MEKYTIICNILTTGHITEVIEKDKVRAECERLKNLTKLGDEHTYMRIEVVNNETGEVREYWNNQENVIKF